MSINKAIIFSEFDWFYQRYNPLTPYGIESKIERVFVKDTKALNAIHKGTDLMIAFLEKEQHEVALLEHYLRRIDHLNDLEKEVFDAADILLIKRFLLSYKAIATKFSAQCLNNLALNWQSEELLALLCLNNDTNESFFLSSAYDNRLKLIRDKIDTLNNLIDEDFKQQVAALNDLYALDFTERDFLLVDIEKAQSYKAEHLYSQSYDAKTVLVKPVLSKLYSEQQTIKETLLAEEYDIEQHVLTNISNHIKEQKHHIIRYVDEIKNIDVFLARARMVKMFSLTKPILSERTEPLKINEARFLPLQMYCKDNGLKYTPLSIDFEDKTILLSGSNMGGKTVLFKTLAFLQLLTQFGFFVPAANYKTSLFDQINVVDDSEQTKVNGLSSFGQEVYELNAIIKDLDKPMLLLIDELAKSTNATEAKAILYGVLKMMTNKEQVCSLFSSHYIDMPEIQNVAKYRMKGLNRKALSQHYTNTKSLLFTDKMQFINNFMEYEIEKQEKDKVQYDAINIAKLLGMSEEIIGEANEFLQQ